MFNLLLMRDPEMVAYIKLSTLDYFLFESYLFPLPYPLLKLQ